MDAVRARLVDTLTWLSAELTAGQPLAICLRQLPRVEYQTLCAPFTPRGLPWPLRRERERTAEAILLARLALSSGADEPRQLAAGLARLAADLRATPP